MYIRFIILGYGIPGANGAKGDKGDAGQAVSL